jgi:hypothetical protein
VVQEMMRISVYVFFASLVWRVCVNNSFTQYFSILPCIALYLWRNKSAANSAICSSCASVSCINAVVMYIMALRVFGFFSWELTKLGNWD